MAVLTGASTIGLGTSRLRSLVDGLSRRSAVRLLRDARELGVTFFDTANSYGRGEAETAVGEAFAGDRDDVAIATKVGLPVSLAARLRQRLQPFSQRGGAEPRRIYSLTEVHASLARLRTDHVDVLYLHNPGPPDSAAGELLVVALERGLCRAVGVSVSGSTLANEWANTGIVSVVQLPAGIDRVDQLRDHRSTTAVTVVGREVFAGGRMFDPDWAAQRPDPAAPTQPMEYFAWLIESKLVDHVLVGTNDATHLKQAVEAASGLGSG